MSNHKDGMTNGDMSMLVVDTAPVQRVSKSEIEAATKRMAVIVSDAPNMSTEQLATIAQESILYRTVPGRDVHYFLSGGKLLKVLDYKYLKNFANFKEQMLSGNDNAAIDDSYRILTEAERAEHNINDNMIAAKCTIITERERNQFGNEVKRWLDMGFDAPLAIATAKEVIGDLGASAIGVVSKSGATPKGWSSMQLAEKLAFKNAVNRKYGQPTADEMAMMAYRMAQRATPDHWKDVDPTLPIEAQAVTANLVAQVETIEAESEAMTTEEHSERLAENVSLLRGEEDEPIGEDAGELVIEQPAEKAPQTNQTPATDPKLTQKAPLWPTEGIAKQFTDEIRAKTDYYENGGTYRLSKAIGGYGNLNDKDNYEAKMSAGVDHAKEKQAASQAEETADHFASLVEPELFSEPAQQTAYSTDT